MTEVFELKCAMQEYPWGRLGSDSEVAQLNQNNDPSFQLQPNQPYAELWMGTHPKGPSIIKNGTLTGQPLVNWIKENPQSLGAKVQEKFNNKLPFLFKVLSVNKSLSIQAHPTKEHAEKLYKERPDKYPDDNHKPEMALALTPFEGFCGFRPVDEIVKFLQDIPEFTTVVGEDNASQLIEAFNKGGDLATTCRDALKRCFTGLMTRDAETITKQLNTLVQRINNDDVSPQEGSILQRLYRQFPDDVGCFGVYFFNRVLLEPGQAMFLGPNEPHAYLSGNCIECMACSDNVVRAGLTPKYKDIPTLCDMLNYNPSTPNSKIFPCRKDAKDDHVTIYSPPVPDFAVDKIEVDGKVDYTISAYNSASIILVIKGQAEANTEQALKIHRGSVIFVSANQNLPLKCQSEKLLLFRAYCPLL
ncbi:mannose-6-phosphate isomerase-like isoform X2 [Anneissia japonica]|uniref:mannose-6-phosphate isomerase-like isoform X2 n=1 Tax=Anneissia japonica TaxID=1529436 RepID=UPI0014259355|nr:mannose-6-phosphate isomerase-like isoform X2 [Anneissia japonica]